MADGPTGDGIGVAPVPATRAVGKPQAPALAGPPAAIAVSPGPEPGVCAPAGRSW